MILNPISKRTKNMYLFMSKIIKYVDLTRFIVSGTVGNGKRGSDPWKLYSMGLCQPENNFTSNSQTLVTFDDLLPLPLVSYIHPLYMSNSFNVYRITYMTVSHKNSPTTKEPARCASIEDLSRKTIFYYLLFFIYF